MMRFAPAWVVAGLIGVAANLDSIFMLMPKGEIYQAGKWVVIIVGMGKLVDMLFGPSSEIIIYSKYYSFNILLILLLSALIITTLPVGSM